MEQRINIAELLKDCPTGMELDCTMYDNVTLLSVDDREDICFPIRVVREDGNSIALTKYGQYTDANFAKCVIFPKDKTTWEGFHRPFKDGDIITCTNSICSFVAIFKKMNTTITFMRYISLTLDDVPQFSIKKGWADFKNPRFATEEEKEKLFKAIKDNGYKWNPETRTLEKLIEPKFKVGDKIVKKDIPTECWYVQGVNTNCNSDYFYHIVTIGKIANLHFKDQDNWELVPTHKFKVGDKVKSIFNNTQYTITELTDTYYVLEEVTNKFRYVEPIVEDKNWELVSNKFDITTLKPFDKVLVRLNNDNQWYVTWFSHIDKNHKSYCYPYVTVSGKSYTQIIPYEGNEHLLGTTNDCDDYFKIWN